MLPILTITCLVATTVPTATPTTPAQQLASPAARQQVRAEALNYASQLLVVVNQIENSYVRPVPRPELFHAALTGLYEAARVPVPRNLRADLGRLANNDSELIDRLVQCREQVGEAEAVQGPAGLLASCRGLTRALDPHSGLVSEEEHQRMRNDGEVNGIGLEVAENVGVGPLRIKAIHPGSPAQQAGLRPGDEITEIDRLAVQGLTSDQARGLLHPHSASLTTTGFNNAESGPVVASPDSSNAPETSRVVRLTVRRGDKVRKVRLEPGTYRTETALGVRRDDCNRWDYFVDRPRGVAHVRLTHLGKGTGEELRSVVHQLKADGLRGLVLDLRWCPGGYLNEAVQVAGLFLDETIIVRVRNRGDSEQKYTNTVPRDSRLVELPLIVLVNGETSGGAELIVAALQDYNRALVAGQRTLGKASVQTTLHVHLPGNTMKLTTGTFQRPSGKNLHRFPESKLSDDWGIQPEADLEFRLSREAGQQLKAWWELQTLRPGTGTERLPLDDPAQDPQRDVAIQGLKRLLEQARR